MCSDRSWPTWMSNHRSVSHSFYSFDIARCRMQVKALTVLSRKVLSAQKVDFQREEDIRKESQGCQTCDFTPRSWRFFEVMGFFLGSDPPIFSRWDFSCCFSILKDIVSIY